jgi:hypothetical protein
LRVESHARPGKLFTASQTLIVASVGKLEGATFAQVLDAVIAVLRRSAGP